MSLRHALLGLLAEEPASGYDLTRKFERVLQRYAWHAKNSQIYPELNQLARDGLIGVVEEGPRGRRTYAITDAGRTELRRWMRNPPDIFTVRNEFVLRLFLLPVLDPAEVRAALSLLAAQSQAAQAELRQQVEKFDAAAAAAAAGLEGVAGPSGVTGLGGASGPGGASGLGNALPMNRLVAEFGLRSFQTMQDWASWALDHLPPADPAQAGTADGR